VPFFELEDVGTTKRKAMSPTRRLRIWETCKGVCCLCHQKIDGVRDLWIIEHKRALELGGVDEDANCAPAHKLCAERKTNGATGDHAMAAKAKRMKRAHLGIKKAKTKLAGGKGSKWKRTIGGGTVLR
jgi:hypothetical protein